MHIINTQIWIKTIKHIFWYNRPTDPWLLCTQLRNSSSEHWPRRSIAWELAICGHLNNIIINNEKLNDTNMYSCNKYLTASKSAHFRFLRSVFSWYNIYEKKRRNHKTITWNMRRISFIYVHVNPKIRLNMPLCHIYINLNENKNLNTMILRIFYFEVSPDFFREKYLWSDKEEKIEIEIRYLCIIASWKEVILIFVTKVI